MHGPARGPWTILGRLPLRVFSVGKYAFQKKASSASGPAPGRALWWLLEFARGRLPMGTQGAAAEGPEVTKRRRDTVTVAPSRHIRTATRLGTCQRKMLPVRGVRAATRRWHAAHRGHRHAKPVGAAVNYLSSFRLKRHPRSEHLLGQQTSQRGPFNASRHSTCKLSRTQRTSNQRAVHSTADPPSCFT